MFDPDTLQYSEKLNRKRTENGSNISPDRGLSCQPVLCNIGCSGY